MSLSSIKNSIVKCIISIFIVTLLAYAITSYALKYGTAFFIDSKGRMATAYHVVEGASKLFFFVDGKKYYATAVALDTYNDIAILQTNYKNNNYLSFSFAQRYGGIHIYGFPYIHNKISSFTGTDGKVVKFYKETIWFNGFMCQGNSGGPILDYTGSVLGLVTDGIVGTSRITGCYNEGYGPTSYAIKKLADRYRISIYANTPFDVINLKDVIVILYAN